METGTEAMRVSTVNSSKSVDRISDVEIGMACRISGLYNKCFFIYVITNVHDILQQQHVTMSEKFHTAGKPCCSRCKLPSVMIYAGCPGVHSHSKLSVITFKRQIQKLH